MKKFILVLLMAVCSVYSFAERWHCYMSNDDTEAYYDVDNKNICFDEVGIYDSCTRNGDTYWLVEDVQLSERGMGEDFVHYVNATKYGFVIVLKGHKTYYLYWLGYKTDYLGNKYHTFAWVETNE